VIKGENLFETLVALMIPMDIIGIVFDTPPIFWRRKSPVIQKAEIGQTSWLGGLLFPTRRIALIPDDATGNVMGVYLSQGENYVNKEAWRDPYATYRSNDTSVFPLRPHADSPIWRNYCDILDISGNHASVMLQQYQAIHDDSEIHLTLYGAETNQASYLSIQRYDFILPLKLAESERIKIMKACIEAAQRLLKALRRSLESIALLPNTVKASTLQKYETMCEERFGVLCHALEKDCKSRKELYETYCVDSARDVMKTFDAAVLSLQLRAHALVAVENARDKLSYEIKKLRKEEEIQ